MPASLLPLSTGVWLVDQRHSAVTFSVRHLGLSKVRGRFDRFDATLNVGDSVADVIVEAAIDLASVSTNNADRDTHLQTSDFFNTERNAQMTFRSRSVAGAGERWGMDGDLSINGNANRTRLEVRFNGIQPFYGVPHAGFEVAGELKRSEFGIDFGLVDSMGSIVVSDTVSFDLDLQFVHA